jgi:hypothetical protein
MKFDVELRQTGGCSTSLNPEQGTGTASESGAETASELGDTDSADLSLSRRQRFFKTYCSADVFKLVVLPLKKDYYRS